MATTVTFGPEENHTFTELENGAYATGTPTLPYITFYSEQSAGELYDILGEYFEHDNTVGTTSSDTVHVARVGFDKEAAAEKLLELTEGDTDYEDEGFLLKGALRHIVTEVFFAGLDKLDVVEVETQ